MSPTGHGSVALRWTRKNYTCREVGSHGRWAWLLTVSFLEFGFFSVTESDRRKVWGDKKKFSISDFWPRGRKKSQSQTVVSTLPPKLFDPDVDFDLDPSIAGW